MTDEAHTMRFKTDDELAELMSDVLPMDDEPAAETPPPTPPPAAEPVDPSVPSEVPSEEPAPTEEASPPATAPDDWTFKYQVNHEDRAVDLKTLLTDEEQGEAFRAKIQKGEDYDRVKEQVENLRVQTEAQRAHNERVMQALVERGLATQQLDGSYQWATNQPPAAQPEQPTTPAKDNGKIEDLRKRVLEDGDTKAVLELIELEKADAIQRTQTELTAHQQRQAQQAQQAQLANQAAALIKAEIDANAEAFKFPDGQWDQQALQTLQVSTQQFVMANPSPQVVNQARQHIRNQAEARRAYAEAIRKAERARMVTPPAAAPPIPGALGGSAPPPAPGDEAIPSLPGDTFNLDDPRVQKRNDAIAAELGM